MPLFKMDSDTMKKLNKQTFRNEKDLQNLIEKNLEEIFGIRFVATEYPFPNGRIDTLGIDEKNTPVIIEYKQRQDSKALVQGLAYVNWIKKNRRTFEMLVREKLGKEIGVDWSLGARLIIIAEAFDKKETSAIEEVKDTVELKKHAFYGDMVSIDDFAICSNSFNKTTSCSERIVKDEEMIPTLEQYLEKIPTRMRKHIENLRDKIFSFSDDIEEKLSKKMICYYSGGKGLAWLEFPGNSLRIHLRKGNYSDKRGKVKHMGWGGYPELTLKENEIDINYILGLFKQAYQK